MLKRIWAWLTDWRIIRLAIVRKYTDANGNYIGELYLHDDRLGWRMIGASLDSLPLGFAGSKLVPWQWHLDTRNDFLAPMPSDTVRVGALEPEHNEFVQHRIAKLPRMGMELMIENRFIEHVLKQERI